ncbi:MAG TPA: electron transfer flavoprotein subunit alpha/FixB family protein [Candidatus Polarisedimenticolaceae bacterium]|nr:electron transfer flavoprotein subunit alpha/FixB family protein [Candidatus Polarisedimenticolaceae bacterium]
MANVLVFVERREGEIKRPSLQVLTEGRRLAAAGSGRVDALVLGPGAAAAAASLARYGAERVFHVEDPSVELYSPELYSACLVEATGRAEADFVLLAATAMGKDLAARTAARLDTACASDVVEIEVDRSGGLRAKRPVYSGKAVARVVLKARPAVATLRPNVFAASEAAAPAAGAAEALGLPLDPAAARVTTRELRKPDRQELDVAEASIIVSGGRGLKDPKNFSLVRELADALGGAVGASRAVVDAGWIAHSHQVGQTGKVVSPTLYIAAGISGAIQHLAGMSSSAVIVAINKDPDAPIFKVADYGIVGDLFDVLPALTRAVRELKN